MAGVLRCCYRSVLVCLAVLMGAVGREMGFLHMMAGLPSCNDTYGM